MKKLLFILFFILACGVASAQTAHSVTLTVGASTDASANKYTFYRGTVKGGPYATVVCTDNPIIPVAATAIFSCVDNNVTALSTYYYVVTASDSANTGKSPSTGTVGESSYSNEVVALIPITIIITPTPGIGTGLKAVVQ